MKSFYFTCCIYVHKLPQFGEMDFNLDRIDELTAD